MRVLQLTSKSPRPPIDGYRSAALQTARYLDHNGRQVSLLTLSADGVAPAASPYAQVTPVRFDVETHAPLACAAALATGRSYILRKLGGAPVDAALRALAPGCDEVWLEGAYPGLWLPRLRELAPGASVVLRAHNVEHELLARVATQRRLATAWLLRREARLIRAFERQVVRDVDRVLAITARDAVELTRLAERDVETLPLLVDVDRLAAARPLEDPPELVLAGHFGWPPNRDGAAWLLREVWPAVAARHPGARLVLVGHSAPPALGRLAARAGVAMTGLVDDVAPYYAGARLVLAPLRSGSGVRVKVVEALATGARVLATTQGAEGVDFDGIARRDDVAGWVQVIDAALTATSGRDEAALAYVRAHHDWRRSL